MARTEKETEGLSLLGNQGVKYPSDYSADILETFVNKHPDNDYFVKFNCPEFTSLCPITGQPDLQPYIYHMFRKLLWWRVSHLSFICLVSAIMVIFMRTV